MRPLLCAVMVALVVVPFVAGDALAADRQAMPSQVGQVSQDTLAQMGLAGMEVFSDTQGEQIRGMGRTRIYAMNLAFVFGAKNVCISQSIVIGR